MLEYLAAATVDEGVSAEERALAEVHKEIGVTPLLIKMVKLTVRTVYDMRRLANPKQGFTYANFHLEAEQTRVCDRFISCVQHTIGWHLGPLNMPPTYVFGILRAGALQRFSFHPR